MTKIKMRQKNNLQKTETHPLYKEYYKSGKYKTLLRITKLRSYFRSRNLKNFHEGIKI